ncbi:flagellar filament capping protein FliD [Denitrificimonas caeni]|uniref:Flagellar hook-associated protein 2 n=1 Tax=Denitrificimonas caeni TaxID=521720 RepID=A0AAE9VMJ6_9GAMM|nr:flagellar filament capping protein FliD [Denitrificimonas caeni]WBE24855.1 flagellar filament capping protein FliD [Denitrificimonas caeni]
MAGIPGIGSGLDIKNIVKAMVDAEVAPKASQLGRLEKTTEAKFSALGQLQSALGNFQTAMKDLNKMALFDNRTATSSNTALLSATAEKTALSGKYSVAVERLASSSKVTTAALDKDFKATEAGSLTVKLGGDDESPVSVNIAEGASLIEIRDALNEQLKDKGVTANIINNPSTGQSQLVLSGKETGSGKDIIVTGAGGNLDALNVNGSVMAQAAVAATDDSLFVPATAGALELAANAVFTIDGLKLESASNTVENVIPDVSFTLKGKTEENKPLTVTVGQDTKGVKDQLKKFVDSYNEFMEVSNKLTAVTKVGDDKAPVVGGLVGDSTVRNLVNSMRNELSNVSGNGDIRVLADLGITTQKDGTLKIDDKKLDAALETNFDSVGQFFAGDNGLMSRMDNRIGGYTGKDGIIGSRQQSLDATRSDITKQKEKLTARAGQIEARLLKQFNAMDALVGQLNTTSQQLLQSLGSLPGMNSRN